MLKDQLKKFANRYEEMYDQGKSSIYHMQSLGLEIPKEFKISAGYTLSHRYNDLLQHSDGFVDDNVIQQIAAINYESKKMEIDIDKEPSNINFGNCLITNINRLINSFEPAQAQTILELFDIMSKLELSVDISKAQNIYYTKIYHRVGDIIENNIDNPRERDLRFIKLLLDIGEKLYINVDFYRIKLDKLEMNVLQG